MNPCIVCTTGFTVLLLIQGGSIDSFAQIGKAVSGITQSSSVAAGDTKIEQSIIKENSTRTEVIAGIYLLNLYDVNTTAGSFGADFWLWFNHKPDEKINLLKSREFLNGKDIQSSNSDSEVKSEVNWAIEKIKGKFIQDFDISKFPYDRHELHLIVEESLKESNDLVYVADTLNSKIDEQTRIVDGWRVESLKLEVKEHQYSSNFGNPSKKDGASYNQLIATIIIERIAEGLLIKVLFGLYIAIAIGLISFFMKTNSEDIFSSRMSLLVGMIFAIVLNKQAAEAVVGGGSGFTIIESVHNIGFVYIFMMIFATLYSRHLSESSSPGMAPGPKQFQAWPPRPAQAAEIFSPSEDRSKETCSFSEVRALGSLRSGSLGASGAAAAADSSMAGISSAMSSSIS